jgi:hypothetical protein
MRRLFILAFSILFISVMITGAMAQENGWKNLTWGMDWRELRDTLGCEVDCKDSCKLHTDQYGLIEVILLHYGISEVTPSDIRGQTSIETFDNYKPKEYDKVFGSNDAIFLKGKFMGVVKYLYITNFLHNTAVQKNIMDQLKSVYPSGTVTTMKLTKSDVQKDIILTNWLKLSGTKTSEKTNKTDKYLSFKYKSSNVEVFNNPHCLIIISPQAAQSIVDEYNGILNKEKIEYEKDMKVF